MGGLRRKVLRRKTATVECWNRKYSEEDDDAFMDLIMNDVINDIEHSNYRSRPSPCHRWKKLRIKVEVSFPAEKEK